MRGIEILLAGLGRVLAWLMILLAVLASSVLVLRYGFGFGSVALQEMVVYLNGFLVMLGLAVTLQANAHVRVDVVSSRWTDQTQALRDLIGVLVLLLPMLVSITWFSWDYVARSWAIAESSGDAGGLAGVYWFKSLILLGMLLLFVAAVAFAYHAWRAWRGLAPVQLIEAQHEL